MKRVSVSLNLLFHYTCLLQEIFDLQRTQLLDIVLSSTFLEMGEAGEDKYLGDITYSAFRLDVTGPAWTSHFEVGSLS